MRVAELLTPLWAAYREEGHWTGLRLDDVVVGALAEAPALSVRSTREQVALRDMREQATLLAEKLAHHGLAAGSRVFLLVTQPVSDLTTLLALSRLGVVTFFSPPGLSIDEILRALALSGADHVVVDALAPTQLLSGLETRLAQQSLLVVSPGRADVQVRGGSAAGTGSRESSTLSYLSPGTEYVTFTSGTTGEPKGILHNTDTMTYAARHALAQAEPRQGPVIGYIALAHAAGLAFSFFSALVHRRDLIVYHGKWDAPAAVSLLLETSAAWSLATPTHLHDIVHELELRSESLKRFTMSSGGAPVHPDLVARAQRVGITACRVFGLSECLGHTSTRGSDPLEIRMASEGRSYPGTRDVVLDETGNPCRPGSEGEAACRGPSMFLGYLGQEEADERFTNEGFFRTGDRIRVDGEDRITVLGRLKDIIIRGGENIDPVEVTTALQRMPGVLRASVLGIPDARLGERVGAALEFEGELEPSRDDVWAHLKQMGLPRFKWPEIVTVLSELPTNAVGKVDRQALRAKLRAGTSRNG